jgi:hypothetical protein
MNEKVAEDEQSDEPGGWHVHRLDPDNFLIIPEFGVMPESVEWKGFMLPLVHPDAPDPYVYERLRIMLRAARIKIRKRFDTLAEVFRFFHEASDMPISSMSEHHLDATFFGDIQGCILDAALTSNPLEDRFRALAEASSMLANWLTLESHTLRLLAIRRASSGGKKSAEERAKKGISKEAVVAAAKEYGWPNKTYGVQKKLSKTFNCDVSYIAKILAAAKKEFRTEASSVPN